ncbi:MAG: oxidoreductase, partial [Vicinamibacterales bacterium]
MTLTVAGLSVIAEDVVRLRLVDDAGVTLPDFEAGAHVELSFAGFRRRYSLTSSPSDRSAYEVMVLRARPGRGGS